MNNVFFFVIILYLKVHRLHTDDSLSLRLCVLVNIKQRPQRVVVAFIIKLGIG